MADAHGRTLRVTVDRSDPAAASHFELRVGSPAVVLDVLAAIRRDHDPGLAFRYSCRMAMCGTCTVQVDGRPVLACETEVPAGAAALRVGPLGGFPVVRDLVVDTKAFGDAWATVLPGFSPAGGSGDLADPAAVHILERFRGCISCGACYAACGLAAAWLPFLGPAALTRALTLIADPRDGADAARLGALDVAAGLEGCHSIGACSVVCPVGLDPAAAIRLLRRRRWKR